jgi:hypothetical protein
MMDNPTPPLHQSIDGCADDPWAVVRAAEARRLAAAAAQTRIVSRPADGVAELAGR